MSRVPGLGPLGRLALAFLVMAGLAWPGPQAQAQGLSAGVPQSEVLVVEPDRLFAESAFGRRLSSEIEAEGTQIAAENRRIEAELTSEERDLTDRRAALPIEEFRALADAFDEKVQRLRREQDAKARALGTRTEEAQGRFLVAVQPVLAALMQEAGAVAILERRAVFLSADLIDITDLAITQLDARIGDGSTLIPATEP